MCLWNKQTKSNQTQSKQTKNHLLCLFVQTVYQNQTNQTFSTINSIKSSWNQKYLKSLLELRNSCTDLYLFGSVRLGSRQAWQQYADWFPPLPQATQREEVQPITSLLGNSTLTRVMPPLSKQIHLKWKVKQKKLKAHLSISLLSNVDT